MIHGKTFHRNLELVVDAASGAAVGISVRDEEDSAAVVQVFTQGVATTGGTPLALLLDNRPSSHTPEVDAALDDTLRIRATPDRPQNKPHVEVCFGYTTFALSARDRAHLERAFLRWLWLLT